MSLTQVVGELRGTPISPERQRHLQIVPLENAYGGGFVSDKNLKLAGRIDYP